MKIEIKPVRGVYFLLRKGELFYVGMSENVARRIEDHRVAKSFDRAYAIPLPNAPREEMAALERALIRAFNPPGNKAGRNPVDWVDAPSSHLHPERYRPMPPEAAELLHLADKLCGAACELANQREPAEPWGETPFERSPVWSYETLAKALNEYYEARHLP